MHNLHLNQSFHIEYKRFTFSADVIFDDFMAK